MTQFKKYKLKELVAKANTGLDAIKRAPIVAHDTGIKCLRIQDVSQCKDFKDWGFTEVTKENYEKFSLKEGEIILARTGNTIGVNLFIEKDQKSVFNNGLIRLRVNKEKCNPKYLYYNMQTSSYWSHIDSIAFGTSTQPNMQIESFLGYEIEMPDLPTQNVISTILSSLDDKLEHNRRTNETLEQIAQILFKKYFVDDIDSDNLPEGWKMKSIYDLAGFINGAAFKNSDFTSSKDALPIVKIVELKYGITSTTMFSNKLLDEKYKIENGEILFSWSGSPETSIDTFLWVNDTAWLNQHIFKIVPESREMRTYMYYLLKYFKPVFIDIAKNKQTTGLGHVTINDLKRLKIAFPDVATLSLFASQVSPILDCIQNNLSENKGLATIRDSLLPKLMSGEIEVNVAEQELAEL